MEAGPMTWCSAELAGLSGRLFLRLHIVAFSSFHSSWTWKSENSEPKRGQSSKPLRSDSMIGGRGEEGQLFHRLPQPRGLTTDL